MDTVDSCVTDCPICFCAYDDQRPPLATPCGHSFCRLCVEKLAVASPHRGRFTCPLCNEPCEPGPQGLPINVALRGLVDELAAAAHQRRLRRESSELLVVGNPAQDKPPPRFVSEPRRNSFQYSCPKITYEELELEALIDTGAFGEVHRCKWQGQTVATKVLRCGGEMSPAAVDSFQREVEVMSILHHPNIVLMLGACVEPPRLCLVLELMTGGSLYGLLHCACSKLEAVEVRHIALDMAHGLQYLHSLNILHRDLKSKNVLLTRSLPRQAKLCDFGLSRVRLESATMTGNIGTPQWTAPEILNDSKYRLSADIYSFGIVLLETVTNKLPFSGMNPMAIIMAVGLKKKRPPIPDTIHPVLRDLIDRCTKWNENERPRMLEVVRVLESYLPPEPAKTSVLYQTLAYCEKQLQLPEQNWTVASAIRSISTDVQLKSPANSSPHRAVPHRAMLPESQPEPRTQSIAKGAAQSPRKGMDSSPTAQRALMAATTFFSPVVSNDGDDSPRVTVHMLAEEPMGDGVAAAELPLGYELVESDTTPVESDHTTSSASPNLFHAQGLAAAMSDASGASGYSSSVLSQSPDMQRQIEADYAMALELQRMEDEAVARQHSTEFDSVLARKMHEEESDTNEIPQHLLSSMPAGVDSGMVREQFALEQSLSPSASLSRSPAQGMSPPPPAPPLPPVNPSHRAGHGGQTVAADRAALDMAMRYAFEDIEVFPRNQLRATRTADRTQLPSHEDILAEQMELGVSQNPALLEKRHGVTASSLPPALPSLPPGTIPVLPPPTTGSPSVSSRQYHTQNPGTSVVNVLPPPSPTSAVVPAPPPLPPPPPPPPPATRYSAPSWRQRRRYTAPTASRSCNPRRAFSAVVDEVPGFIPSRLHRSHTVQYSGLPTRREYTLEKQQMEVESRQRQALKDMNTSSGFRDLPVGPAQTHSYASHRGNNDQEVHLFDRFKPVHHVSHMKHMKLYHDNLQKLREFRPETLHHIEPGKPSVLNSGIRISAEALSMFSDMKLNNSKKYVGLNVHKNEAGERGINVVFYHSGVPVSSYDKDQYWFHVMCRKLPEDEPRFVIFDFFHGVTESRTRESHSSYRLAFIFWCPENCRISEKMIYASTKGMLRRQLGGGISMEFNIHSRSDLDYTKLSNQFSRT